MLSERTNIGNQDTGFFVTKIFLIFLILGTSKAFSQLEISDVKFKAVSDKAKISDESLLPLDSYKNIGYSSKIHLFEIELFNPSEASSEGYLEIGNYTLSSLKLFDLETSDSISYETGILPATKVELKPGQKKKFLVETKFGNAAQIGFNMHENISHNTDGIELIFALLGAIIGIVAYSFLVFVSVREKSHFFYVCYAASVTICLSNLTGVTYFVPGWEMLNHWTTFFGPVAVFSLGRFATEFLELKKFNPKIFAFFRIHGFVALGTAGLFLVSGWKEVTYVTDILIATGAPVAVWSGFTRWKSGYRPARFFSMSWTILMLSALYWVGTMTGIIRGPSGALILSSGVFLEMLLLSLALSDHIAELKKQVFAKEKELNLKLKKEVEAEKQTIEKQQQKLVHSEKMASLGLMAKGISHEVNNPLTILKGNAEVVRMQIERGDKKGAKTLPIAKIIKPLDKILLQSDRIAGIIESLHNFARFDTDDPLEPVHLASAVDQILTLTNNHARKNSTKITSAVPDEVFVKARIGQLIQVGTNLVINAIDASNLSKDLKSVEISVEETDQAVLLVVQDSGPGVPKRMQDKIFEPFFTTKSASKGTGLGLSISRGLMEGQSGQLYLRNTEIGCQFIAEFKAASTDKAVPKAS